MIRKLFGSKREVEVPKEPKLDLSNREQMRQIEKEYKKKLQKEVREVERGLIRNHLLKCYNYFRK